MTGEFPPPLSWMSRFIAIIPKPRYTGRGTVRLEKRDNERDSDENKKADEIGNKEGACRSRPEEQPQAGQEKIHDQAWKDQLFHTFFLLRISSSMNLR